MKILLLGMGDSIFLVNYVRALKRQWKDIEVHVYSPFPYNGEYSDLPYDYVQFESFQKSIWYKIPFFSYIALPFVQNWHFQRFIRGKSYDIIHIHRLISVWTLNPTMFKKHCKKLFLSFWGGEMDSELLLKSRSLYLMNLSKLVNEGDWFIGPMSDKRITQRFPSIKNKSSFGVFGSSIIDILCKDNFSKLESKNYFKIPDNKISILIGYSGKEIHQHLLILDEIVKRNDYNRIKNKIHWIASMTRGASSKYIETVENKMATSGSTFTMIKKCYQTDEDVARLRMATDVLFQLSEFDYLSASIKECLCAGNVMISGSWLPYQILKKDGFYFEEAKDIESGVDIFYEIIGNFDRFVLKAQNNKTLCGERYTWDACIKDYINAYKSEML